MRTRIGQIVAVAATLALSSTFVCARPAPAAAADAAAPYRSLHQFQHTRWTIADGAPGQISSLAQTRDGRFWLSAAQSLYQFDGVRFERFDAPDGSPLGGIQNQLATADGSLWLAFQAGGLARLRDGRFRHFGADSGAPARTVLGMAADASGTLWTASSEGLFRHRGERWEKIGRDWNFPDGIVRMVAIARDGTVWVATENSILTLPPHGRRFVASGLAVGWVMQLREAPDGRMWMSEAGSGGIRPLTIANGKAVALQPRLPLESAGLLFARDGSLWINTLGDGLRRLRDPSATATAPVLETFTERDGLSADYAWPSLQDREGNVWIGTSGGLDRFRPSALIPAEFPRGSHDYALIGDPAGGIWAGTTNRPLMRMRDGRLSFADFDQPVRCAYRDPQGRIWLGGDRTLWQLQDGRPREIAPLPDGTQQVQAMALARDGSMWVHMATGGLWRWHEGTWRLASTRIGLQPDMRLRAILSDREGRLWSGLERGELLRMDGRDFRTFAPMPGLKLGAITALAEGAQRIWVGGQFGMGYFDGERIAPLRIDDDEGLWGIGAIIELGNGDLWVHAVPGVFRLAAEELRLALARPGHRMRFERFDFLDGLPGRPTLVRPLPTAVASSDGRLWFATSNGVAWIDPARIARNPLPPPVFVTALRVDGKRYSPGGAVRLPVGAKNVEIAYTALSMAIPSRVKFRYRLEGLDETWQDVGNRRTAYYGRLPPGRYRFQVVASNNDGVWNDTGAALELDMPPAFYQTWWFRGLCVLAGLALLFGLYLLRMRHITRTIQRELAVQHAERERIARDLHDTLLQSVQGLVLRFQSAVEQIPPQGADARNAMESALDRADQVVAEARDRVLELRSHDAESDLQATLARIGQELASGRATALHTLVEGETRPIASRVQEQALAIGREALFNAFQHAQASAIEIEIAYGCDELRLRVRDDGIGIGEEAMARRPRHWGLRGMRERAHGIGAVLRVWGRAGAGTEVELVVPAAVAYPSSPRANPWNWLRAASRLGR